MRRLFFVSCFHLATLALGEEVPKELRALEFGFDVEIEEANTPLNELQWKYRQLLFDLKEQYESSGSTENALEVEEELERLDSPPQLPFSALPELKRLQDAHRARFAALEAERTGGLRSVIEYYVTESRSLAEKWISEDKTEAARTALETSTTFSGYLDEPISFAEFLEKKVAEGGVEGTETPGGPLRAWGVVAERVPIDIQIAGPFNDFVSLEFHNRYWAAVRRNGEVVSSQADLNGLQNVAQIEMNDQRAYVLFRDGKVGSVPPDGKIPSDLEGVKKICVSHRDVLALREGGRIAGWGENYGTPRLRPPETLIDIVDIAQTWGSGDVQGFALHSDGSVSTWGGGEKAVVIPPDLPKIKTLDAGWTKLACLAEDGNAVILDHRGYVRGGMPPEAKNLSSLMIRGPVSAARTKDGRWLAWGNSLMGVSDQIKQLKNTQTITYKLNGHEKGWGALLWIEEP